MSLKNVVGFSIITQFLRQAILGYYPEVPPDNNASERAIRKIKVKQKVSGQFKTQRGAEIYAIIRSITDTCIKNSQNVLSAFYIIAKLVPE